MKIYRVVDYYEFRLLKRYKKFFNKTPYISENFSTFCFNKKKTNRVYFFLNLFDAIEFGRENLIDYFICEFNIDKNLISSYLGVGIYFGSSHKLKFELLIPNNKINKYFNSLKIVEKGRMNKFNIKDLNVNNEILCENFLCYYQISINCCKFDGKYFKPNSEFNKKMLKFIA